MKFTITGKIRGKQRPRVTRSHTYTPKQTIEYEKLVRYSLACTDDVVKFDDDAVLQANIKAYFEVPKSYTKKKIAKIEARSWYQTNKPDSDNIIKIILDALNGVAYKDDTQVAIIQIEKVYTFEEEHIDVEIHSVN